MDLDNRASIENDPTFHHLGVVVKSIANVASRFARSLGLGWDEKVFYDPLQGVRVSFFLPSTLGNPAIELVQPEGPHSPVSKFLEKGGGLHHFCYEVRSLEKQIEVARLNRDLIVREPRPAVAFGGRRIAWVYTRDKVLVEYLERADQ